MRPVLQCHNLTAGYGSTEIVKDFDLELDEGTVLALLGPNGSGKTTLLLTLAGLLPRLSGAVSFHGQPLPSGRPRACARAGIVLVPDNRSLFTGLTVDENLKVASGKRGVAPAEMVDVFPVLKSRWNLPAGALSGGEQQMLAIARALVQRPKVLLIDEMSMGLAPVVVEALLPIVRGVAVDDRVSVVLVEQHVQLALEFADQAIVMVHGRALIRSSAQELAQDPTRLEAAYLGFDTTSLEGPGSEPTSGQDSGLQQVSREL